MSTVYLGMGSNVDAVSHIRAGLAELRQQFGEIALSPVYRSRSVGFDGDDFLNLAVGVQSGLQPLQLKLWLNKLEDRYGRLRNVEKFSDRTLDIDILMYDDLYIRLPELSLPRGELLHFAHVLKPMSDLAPELVHPVAKRTMAELWAGFSGQRDGLELFELPD
ncbi:MAG TPA: 2-amino-4-hydroxy-6-hydroxymethyldihydropteridine diphosphokinase [Xanthomonadales bacterium]|nr:2-amino-4-hydroxy-6-hydroxymethyldihydropteridine diphosphokinase [Xanthomonadales bacterium]